MGSSQSASLFFLLSIFVNLVAEKIKIKKILVFASEIQHFFLLIGLVYFGVPSLSVNILYLMH